MLDGAVRVVWWRGPEKEAKLGMREGREAVYKARRGGKGTGGGMCFKTSEGREGMRVVKLGITNGSG